MGWFSTLVNRPDAEFELGEVVDGDFVLVFEGRLVAGVDLLLERFEIDPGKERLARAGLGAGRNEPPLTGAVEVEGDALDAELTPQFQGLAGDDGIEQDTGAAQRLHTAVEHRIEAAGPLLGLGQLPGLGVADVFVGLAHPYENVLDGPFEGQPFEMLVEAVGQGQEGVAEAFVDGLEGTGGRYHPLAVALQHAQRSVEQIAEIVGQVGVDAFGDGELAEAGVEPEGHVAQQEVAKGVVAVLLLEIEGPHHVAEALAHLVGVAEPVGRGR